jgi:transposase
MFPELTQLFLVVKGHRQRPVDLVRLSTGPLEGLNNKIKLMQRRAYGYRDLDLFTRRILSLRTTRFELVG